MFLHLYHLIDLLVDQSSGINGGTHPSRAIRKMPYKIETDVNLATVTTTKGSAIGSADVIQVLDIPGKSLVYAAGLEMVPFQVLLHIPKTYLEYPTLELRLLIR